MKIEFLNAERTRARVTRGWFRKVVAVLVESEVFHYFGEDFECLFSGVPYRVWTFESTGREVTNKVSIALHNAKVLAKRTEIENAAAGREWIPIKS